METAEEPLRIHKDVRQLLCICSSDYSVRRPMFSLVYMGVVPLSRAHEEYAKRMGRLGRRACLLSSFRSSYRAWYRRRAQYNRRESFASYFLHLAECVDPRTIRERRYADAWISESVARYPHSQVVWVKALGHLAPIREQLRGLYE